MKKQLLLLYISCSIAALSHAQSPLYASLAAERKPGTVVPGSLYAGQWLRISVPDTVYAEADMLYAELSGPDGDFADPVVIGSLRPHTGVAGAQYIDAGLPCDLAVSDNYHLRLVSSGEQVRIQDLAGPFSVMHMHIWFEDADGDGLGNPERSFFSVRDSEPGFVLNNLDTDDTDPFTVDPCGK